MTTPLERAQQVLVNQAFSQFVGAQLTRFDEIIELRLPLKPELMGQYRFAHGGIVSYMADNALTFAGGSVLGEKVVTSEYKINYLKPARGNTLIARAEVVSAAVTQAVCRCDVFVVHAGAETICATALGTIVLFGKN